MNDDKEKRRQTKYTRKRGDDKQNTQGKEATTKASTSLSTKAEL